MLSSVARSGNLSSLVSAVYQVTPNATRPIVLSCMKKAEAVQVEPKPEIHTSYTLSTSISRGTLRPTAFTGLSATSQMRYAHTDFKVPDFSEYRRSSTNDPSRSSDSSFASRKAFSYVIMAGGASLAVYGAKDMVTSMVSFLGPAADVMAMAKIEIKLSDIPEGKSVTYKWRNKPLFVRHRTQEEIDKEAECDISTLRDPQHDLDRVQKPEWLILLGICTHLGCVPIAGTGDYGGYYCPCHGSHYDSSGRIRKGPAPLNLEVPEYQFVDDDTLVVG